MSHVLSRQLSMALLKHLQSGPQSSVSADLDDPIIIEDFREEIDEKFEGGSISGHVEMK